MMNYEMIDAWEQRVRDEAIADKNAMDTSEKRYLRIESLEQLAKLSDQFTPLECFLVLNGGFRSTKYVQYRWSRNGRHWWIEHSIDDTEGYLTGPQLERWTHIPEAIRKWAFYADRQSILAMDEKEDG